MWELPLSYSVLEFFTWNPRWDDYLTKLLSERLNNYKKSKGL
jgi:hypothetical protein